MEKKLYRDEYRKMICGVCAGLSDYFGVDVTIIRVLFVLALIFHGGGGLVYIVLLIVMPKKPFQFTDPANPATVDYIVPPFKPGEPFVNVPKKRSSGGLIVGIVLIILGTLFLMNEFDIDIIPDWDFGRLWPVILVAIGVAFIISGQQKKPWEEANWHNFGHKDDTAGKDNSSNTNPPTV